MNGNEFIRFLRKPSDDERGEHEIVIEYRRDLSSIALLHIGIPA